MSIDTKAPVTMDTHICSICGESRDISKARFAHVRIGLDEPPEAVVCKCKDPIEIINMITNKYTTTKRIEVSAMDNDMDTEAPRVLNPVTITTMSTKAEREVELRLGRDLGERMYMMMESGFFGDVTVSTITAVSDE